MGPRQMTGVSSATKNPMDRQRTPLVVGGTTRSPMMSGSVRTPSIFGTENPYTSASRMPTSYPALVSATARLTVTDDLPTPPLPEEMPRIRVLDRGSMHLLGRPSS